MFTYIYSLLIERDICDRRSVSIKLPCVCMCLSSTGLFIFLVRDSEIPLSFPVFCKKWINEGERSDTYWERPGDCQGASIGLKMKEKRELSSVIENYWGWTWQVPIDEVVWRKEVEGEKCGVGFRGYLCWEIVWIRRRLYPDYFQRYASAKIHTSFPSLHMAAPFNFTLSTTLQLMKAMVLLPFQVFLLFYMVLGERSYILFHL